MSEGESKYGALDAMAQRALGDREPLIKAHFIGVEKSGLFPDQSEPATSNVMQGVDESERAFSLSGAIEPPYNPLTLVSLLEHSNSLRQNIDALATNIDGFGHHFLPLIDLEASDAEERIANALYIEKLRLKMGGPHIPSDFTLDAVPTPEEIAAKRANIRDLMRIEKCRVDAFFDFCCIDQSFVSLRRRTRQDIEVLGNGFWEVLRNDASEIVQFVYMPAFTVRILPLDRADIQVEVKQKFTELAFETIAVKKRFRRYIQVFEMRSVYFKEFGDPRTMSAKTGRYFRSLDEMLAADPNDVAATELLHFKIHNPRSAYGVPRWIGNLLAVLGSRQAEEVNYIYFENKSVPPLALLVSGGRVTEETINRIKTFIENEVKGKKNFHKILVLEAEPSGSGSPLEHAGRMKIELRPLTDAMQKDALFQSYDERNIDKVGQSFRLPRLLRGDMRDFNRSTGDAALEFAEQQVFGPEREEFDFIINRKILPELGVRFWRFTSNTPTTKDPKDLAGIIRDLVLANVLTPEEGRELSQDVFNRELKRINAPWVKQPVPLTLAGLAPVEEGGAPTLGPQNSFGAPPDQSASTDKGDLSLADLQTHGGLLGLHQGRTFRRAPSPASKATAGLTEEAARLLALRKLLIDAEASAAADQFKAAKLAELEREVMYLDEGTLRRLIDGEQPDEE
jgi:PBSX family phage portal protein